MTAFILKLIAMGSMLIDHVGLSLFDNNHLMRSIGRLAFILYAFMMAESYCHLQNKPDRLRSHMLKLLLLFAVSEIPFNLFDYRMWSYPERQNVMGTLALGYAGLIAAGWWMRKLRDKRAAAVGGSILICLLAAAVSYLIRSEYKFAGVLLIVMFYLYLPERIGVLAVLFVCYIGLYVWSRGGFRGDPWLAAMWKSFRPFVPGTLAAIIPIALYNRQLGYRSRWFQILYSCFYPAQFVLLLAVRILTEG